MNGLLNLEAKNPKTIMEQTMVSALSVKVSQGTAVLFLNTTTKAKAQREMENIMSVQKPVKEMSVNKTVAR